MSLHKRLASTSFRWASLFSDVCAMCLLLTWGFLHWWISSQAIVDIDRAITDLADAFSTLPAQRLNEELQQFLERDLRRVHLIGRFAEDGSRLGGNVETLPFGLAATGYAREFAMIRLEALRREETVARAIVRRLDDGSALVVGRSIDEVRRAGSAVDSALALSVVPVLCFGLAAGALRSRRARARIDLFDRSVQKFLTGDLRERLPLRGTNDPLEEFAILFNAKLDEIEALIRGLSGVGDQIAHDLRTPLTSVRMVLERGRDEATRHDQIQTVFEQAIGGLDRSLNAITGLLRIAEIDQNRRLAGFADISLTEFVRAAGELYEPLAEQKGVALIVEANDEIIAWGDRDLLLEAISNLVDNAVKYTPRGGRVELRLCRTGNDDVVRIIDTGPGIPEAERDLVTRRFYRSERTRRAAPGLGLGLSLVHAIIKLHGFRFTILPGPGCVVQISLARASSRCSSLKPD
ncbi:HAMP domain-containing histidine kinase [Bradyrhizobium sp. 61]|uniref:sensor histidine kinase n=1 Tax=Bradyrhizobium sp. 61 TaxID=2782679 RepID=UPI001FF96E08|nr:HAMP domain-containing sensor histidine kinase [Bradyrhizobium sp. 61]MCK1277390.1 HAMP domain-containing histidine kinase [Bradyrhizobium sp. 61]